MNFGGSEPSVTPKKANGPAFAEIGKTGLKHSGGWIYEEFVPRLQWPRAGTIYLEMSSNDPVITAILLCSKMLIRNVEWSVTPASKSKADMEAAEFLRECMQDMSSTWADTIDDITSFFEFGFSYHEIVYKRRLGDSNDPSKRSEYNDGRIGWRKIAGRAQNTIVRWELSDDGGIIGAVQSGAHGDVLIPLSRALLFRTTASKNNPEGRSFLRGAYRPWYFKKHIEEIEGIGIERDLAGLPLITAPDGLDLFDNSNPAAVQAKDNALSLVKSIRRDRNEGVVLPHGWDLKLLSASSSRTFDTNAIINRYDQRIAITMLADIVMLGADKVGSFALAKVKQSMLSAALDAQLKSVVEIFNRHAIPRLFKLNTFPGISKYPTLSTTSVVAPDLKELGDFIKSLAGSDLDLWPDLNLENYLRRVAGLPEIDEADATKRKPSARNKNNNFKKGGKEENVDGEE